MASRLHTTAAQPEHVRRLLGSAPAALALPTAPAPSIRYLAKPSAASSPPRTGPQRRSPAPTGGAGGALPPHPDKALIRLGEQLVAAMRAEAAAWRATANEPHTGGPLSDKAGELTEAVKPIVAQIEQQHATTHVGLIVKLRAAFWLNGGIHDADRDSPYPYHQALAAISDNLDAMDVTMAGAGVRA